MTRSGPARLALAAASLALLAGCATMHPKAGPPAPPPKTGQPAAQVGVASYYAKKLDGRVTASGERYDMKELTAAHRTLPFGSRVKVTNLHNGKSVVVRINDRGPYAENRVIDLSYAAARALQFIDRGTTRVRLDVIDRP
jgi:rare lipoprotein A